MKVIKSFNGGEAIFELENNNLELVGVNECFLMDGDINSLPVGFIKKEKQIYPQVCLFQPTNTLISLTIKGKISCINLKRLFPTIFDLKYIKRRNKYEENKELIKECVYEVFGEERGDEIIEKYCISRITQ